MNEIERAYRLYCIRQFFMDIDNLIDSHLMSFEEFKKGYEKK